MDHDILSIVFWIILVVVLFSYNKQKIQE